MRRDQMEYRKEYAKEKVETFVLLTSTRLENDDSDSDDIDFNKSMRVESEKGSLDSRREFLTKFLMTKHVQLKDITAAARTTGRDFYERKKKKLLEKRVGLGTKYFQCKN